MTDLPPSDPGEPTEILAPTEVVSSVPPATTVTTATTDTGAPVGTIKIIARPGGSGYLGVYHVSNASGAFFVRVGTSKDLTHWKFSATLASGITCNS